MRSLSLSPSPPPPPSPLPSFACVSFSLVTAWCAGYGMRSGSRHECQRNLANSYRRRMTVVLAARILTRDISEQRTDDLNHLMGVRIFPTFADVRKVWEEIFIKIARSAGVEVLLGLNGEVGYWPLRKIISYVLSDDDLRGIDSIGALHGSLSVTARLSVESVCY